MTFWGFSSSKSSKKHHHHDKAEKKTRSCEVCAKRHLRALEEGRSCKVKHCPWCKSEKKRRDQVRLKYKSLLASEKRRGDWYKKKEAEYREKARNLCRTTPFVAMTHYTDRCEGCSTCLPVTHHRYLASTRHMNRQECFGCSNGSRSSSLGCSRRRTRHYARWNRLVYSKSWKFDWNQHTIRIWQE